jgi:FkbM family methyltransferase
VIVSSVFRKLRKVPLIVRRFGLIQACRLLVPELVRGTRISSFFDRPLSGYVGRFRMRDSTVLLFRPFSMDLGIFHEIWDHERYTAGTIGGVARRGTVVDVGAHIGLFSIFASRIFHASRIVCVEPDPGNFELLAKNISANHLEHATTLQAAIAGESGEKRIYVNQSNTGGHSFYGGGSSSRLVRAISLIDLFRSSGISECSLLKMDCEGAEMEIFENASDELLRRVSAISLEYHLDAYPPERLEKLWTRMERLGFNLEKRPTSASLGILHGTRRSQTSRTNNLFV